MTIQTWRGVINTILYVVQFRHELGDEVVTQVARLILEDPFAGTPAEEYAAIVQALRSDEPLSGGIAPHGEEELRGFLARLRDQLDVMRPWPELPYRILGVSHWPDFAGARPIASIGMSWVSAQPRMRTVFRRPDGQNIEVLILRLRSGAEVALAGETDGNEIELLLQPDSDLPQEQVLAEFLAATNFTGAEVAPLPG